MGKIKKFLYFIEVICGLLSLIFAFEDFILVPKHRIGAFGILVLWAVAVVAFLIFLYKRPTLIKLSKNKLFLILIDSIFIVAATYLVLVSDYGSIKRKIGATVISTIAVINIIPGNKRRSDPKGAGLEI